MWTDGVMAGSVASGLALTLADGGATAVLDGNGALGGAWVFDPRAVPEAVAPSGLDRKSVV